MPHRVSQSYSHWRLLLAAAAAVNLASAAWTAVEPNWVFDVLGQTPPAAWLVPVWIVALLVTGVCFAYAAIWPERGDVPAAIGLAGKLMGPSVWLWAVAEQWLPPAAFLLILPGDIIWWFPLGMYLLRNRPRRRSTIAGLCVALHVVACVALLAVRQGTEANPDLLGRAEFIASHRILWCGAWLAWTLASISLLAFCAVWAAALRDAGAGRGWLFLACGIVGVGVLFDLAGEATLIVRATQPALSPQAFAEVVRAYQILSPAAANGHYCIGGLLLSTVSWKVGWLRGSMGIVGFAMWLIGLALTVAAVLDHAPALAVSGAGVMLLFILWASFVTRRLAPVFSRIGTNNLNAAGGPNILDA